MTHSSVLVLNRNYLPIDVTSVRRAFVLVYQEAAKVVDEQYQTFDFPSWSALSVEAHHPGIGMVQRLIRIPRVILLTAFDRIPKKTVRFSRLNIFLRDHHICQYCGNKFPKSALNIDHVHPRSRGGQSVWENVVCSCFECNRRKGGRTPHEAGMILRKQPVQPTWNFFLDLPRDPALFEAWKPFLNWVDFSYWNVEIEP